jgi:hypothetical protein
MDTKQELLKKLAKVREEIADMRSSSYSQSNPAYVLGLRSLLRIEERLVAQLFSFKPVAGES